MTKHPCDTGTVTAEFAMILPAVLALAVLLLALASAIIARMDCQDAAAAAARELVISGDAQRARDVAVLAAGQGTSMETWQSGRQFVITTNCPIVSDAYGLLPVSVSAKAAGLIHE
jgi:Flp pilus assembly protein TadG